MTRANGRHTAIRQRRKNKIQTYFKLKQRYSYGIDRKFGFYLSLDLLRHTFATRGLERGMTPKVMQTILGHSTLAMKMDLYSHVLPDTKAEEMKKISNLF